MITSPIMVEAFIVGQGERAGCKFNALQRELLDIYVELSNLESDAGAKDEEPIDTLKDTAELCAQEGKLEELEKPVLKHFYMCMQYWCREAWKQGATKANSRKEHENYD